MSLINHLLKLKALMSNKKGYDDAVGPNNVTDDDDNDDDDYDDDDDVTFSFFFITIFIIFILYNHDDCLTD